MIARIRRRLIKFGCVALVEPKSKSRRHAHLANTFAALKERGRRCSFYDLGMVNRAGTSR